MMWQPPGSSAHSNMKIVAASVMPAVSPQKAPKASSIFRLVASGLGSPEAIKILPLPTPGEAAAHRLGRQREPEGVGGGAGEHPALLLDQQLDPLLGVER